MISTHLSRGRQRQYRITTLPLLPPRAFLKPDDTEIQPHALELWRDLEYDQAPRTEDVHAEAAFDLFVVN